MMKQKNDRIAIGCIIKQEEKYIKEWVEHYINLGFDKIFIIDNNDTYNPELYGILEDYIRRDLVEVITDFIGLKNAQTKSYTKLFRQRRHEFEWIAFLDSDEFLEFEDPTLTIHDFVNLPQFQNFNMIRLNWKVYNDSDIIEIKDDNYSVKRFTQFSRLDSYEVKSIIKTSLLARPIQAHGFAEDAPDIMACDVFGNRVVPSGWFIRSLEGVWKIAWINHYRLKTLEEFIRKNTSRGDNCYSNGLYKTTIWYFFLQNNAFSVEKYLFAKNLLKKLNKSPEEINRVLDSKQIKIWLSTMKYNAMNNWENPGRIRDIENWEQQIRDFEAKYELR